MHRQCLSSVDMAVEKFIQQLSEKSSSSSYHHFNEDDMKKLWHDIWFGQDFENHQDILIQEKEDEQPTKKRKVSKIQGSCEYILLKGKMKGNPCGTKTFKDSPFCQRHRLKSLLLKEETTESISSSSSLNNIIHPKNQMLMDDFILPILPLPPMKDSHLFIKTNSSKKGSKIGSKDDIII